jgi:MYXO-CTERM domain-containing protein
VNELDLGYNAGQAVTLDRGAGGTINANLIQVANGTAFTLATGDHVNALHLVGTSTSTTLNSGVSVEGLILGGGSTATTTDSGNVTSTVLIAGGSTLNMGADLKLSGDLVVNDAGSVVHMNGHTINANLVELGLPGIAAGSLDRGTGGTLNLATGLVVTGTTFYLASGDKMEVLEAQNGAAVTTAATGNVTVDLGVSGGSTVKLGADLVLNQTDSSLTASQQIDVQDNGSTLDAQGHAITAGSMLVGQNGMAPVSVLNLGKVTLDSLQVGNGSSLTLHDGDTIGASLSLTGGSTLDVQQVGGMGLTLNGTLASDLSLTSSQLDLSFTSLAGGWDFRWQDPTGGNWISELQTMINDGQIVLSLLPGETYQLIDSGGYTSITGVSSASVPEPSSLVLGLLAAAGLATATAWRRRRSC